MAEKEEVIVIEEVSGGRKGDGGKPRWELLDLDFCEEVVKVLTFGAEKYDVYNWRKVSPERYQGAVYRHLKAFFGGESLDSETGLHHLAHVGCGLMFLWWLDQEENKEHIKKLERARAETQEAIARIQAEIPPAAYTTTRAANPQMEV